MPYEYLARTTPAANELHLRRLTVDEALLRLDQYLNDAFMAGLYQVRVIHGKGTGTLRHIVRQQLARHPLVMSFCEYEGRFFQSRLQEGSQQFP